MTTVTPSCFNRAEDCKSLSPDEFLERFLRVGFLWFRGGDSQKLPKPSEIIQFLNQHSSECTKSWTVENQGDCKNDSLLTPSSIGLHDKTMMDQSFYVSTIVHRQDEKAFESLTEKLPEFDIFDDLHFSSGAWLFLGHSPTNRKRKRNMIGRAEHVDEVTHSGTYHVQVAGSKTWWIRPHPELYCGDELPDLSTIPGAELSEATKSWRLKVHVEQGDVLVLNTKIWYHYTELPPSEWSISIAQDFYLPVPCPKDVAEGEVVLDEDEIPNEIPRTNEPNCALAEVEGDDDDDDDEAKIVLVALEDIAEGEFLSIANDEEGDDLCNANETVDPRAVAKQDFAKGQIVLQGEEIPHELPRSLEANCEVCDDGENVCLRTLSAVSEGSIFCVLPDENEEYEEVDVDLATGELQREPCH
jgi:hypothetical protein